MASQASNLDPPISTENEHILRMGGFAALAESAWMGSVQATEVLEPLQGIRPTQSRPRLRGIRLSNLLTREYSIAEASVLLMASFFLSAALGAVRQILFNAQFGTGQSANAYYAAFRLPDTLFSLIAGGALSSAMIPVLLSTIQAKGTDAGTRLSRLVLTTLMAVFAAITLIVEIFTPAFVHYILAPGFNPVTTQLTVELTRIMLLQPLFLTVGSVAISVLNSRNQFFLTALSVVSHNLTLIGGIFAVRFFPDLGILGPTLGVVAGGVLQTVILLSGLSGTASILSPVWEPRDASLREIVRLLIPNGLSVGINYSGFIVDTAFATRSVEQASLAAIYNAWLLVGLPIALLGQAIGQAAFPRLAAHAAENNWLSLRKTVQRALLFAIGLAIPAVLALIFLGRPVIRILFEHGQFGAQAGNLTYAILFIYALGLPAFVATELVSRGLIALRDTRTPLITNSIQLGLRAAFMIVLIPQIDVRAIPLALVISASLETIGLAAVFFIKLQRRIVTHEVSRLPLRE